MPCYGVGRVSEDDHDDPEIEEAGGDAVLYAVPRRGKPLHSRGASWAFGCCLRRHLPLVPDSQCGGDG